MTNKLQELYETSLKFHRHRLHPGKIEYPEAVLRQDGVYPARHKA